MVELLQFVFTNFWTFVGFVILLSIFVGSISYGISRFRLVNVVQDNHNVTTTGNEGLSQEDKMFISEVASASIDKFTDVMIYDNVTKLLDPKPNVLYFIKDYKLMIYNKADDKLIVHKIVNLVSIH